MKKSVERIIAESVARIVAVAKIITVTRIVAIARIIAKIVAARIVAVARIVAKIVSRIVARLALNGASSATAEINSDGGRSTATVVWVWELNRRLGVFFFFLTALSEIFE